MWQSMKDSVQVVAPVADTVRTSDVAAKPQRKTVYQVIQSLPEDATPAQQDSAVQAYFRIKDFVWTDSTRGDLPLGSETREELMRKEIDVYKLPGTPRYDWKVEARIYEPQGVAGDPLPYRFRSDDYVSGTLILSFFLVAWVITHSWHFLVGSIKDFFYTRERENMFDSRTDSELRGQLFLVFQTCFVLGLLFFDYTQERMTEVFNLVSPYQILGMGVGICLIYYVAKLLLYEFINSVFFDNRQSTRWRESYFLSILALGLLLLPVSLLVVYFDIGFSTLTLLFFLVVVSIKIMLLYKCGSIFFKYRFGGVHLILYFCALEILPALVLWRALTFANNCLLTVGL